MNMISIFGLLCMAFLFASCQNPNANNAQVLSTNSREKKPHICIKNDTPYKTEVFVNGEPLTVEPGSLTSVEGELNGPFVVQLDARLVPNPNSKPIWTQATVEDGWLRGCNNQNTATIIMESRRSEYSETFVMKVSSH